jgi:hypothetical protein
MASQFNFNSSYSNKQNSSLSTTSASASTTNYNGRSSDLFKNMTQEKERTINKLKNMASIIETFAKDKEIPSEVWQDIGKNTEIMIIQLLQTLHKYH